MALSGTSKVNEYGQTRPPGHFALPVGWLDRSSAKNWSLLPHSTEAQSSVGELVMKHTDSGDDVISIKASLAFSGRNLVTAIASVMPTHPRRVALSSRVVRARAMPYSFPSLYASSPSTVMAGPGVAVGVGEI